MSTHTFAAEVVRAVEGKIDEIHEANLEDVREVSKSVRARLRKGGPYRIRTGAYKASWRFEVKEHTTGTTGIVYSKGHAGLTHLLELGHRVVLPGGRSGGTTRPYKHIEPAYVMGEAELKRRLGVQ
ncbi:hypothetical protein [Gordonibacter urolithinfaciens]|uniref:hypothetical protein n=1 Tax=Gordonibacter urolithinfaciens TaxID=1335613 RepID=UPI003A8EFCA1